MVRSTAELLKQYNRLLTLWPVDKLRPNPELQFSNLLKWRQENAIKQNTAASESKEVNALYSLINDSFAKKYPIPKKLLTPESNPDYYKNILQEVEEAPNRTKSQALWLWLKGKIQIRK